MQIFTREQIETVINHKSLIDAVSEGYVLYTRRRVASPPIASMHFRYPPGEVQIKYGYILDDDIYCIRIASDFPQNPRKGLPENGGAIVIYDQKTGQMKAVLHDEGLLTRLSFSLAGAVAAKHLAPKDVRAIGFLGSMEQAQAHLSVLKEVISCRRVILWHPNEIEGEIPPTIEGFTVNVERNLHAVLSFCNLVIVTAMPDGTYINTEDIKAGTHLTLVTSPDPEKRWLNPKATKKADLIVADSRQLATTSGDIAAAIERALVALWEVNELGDVIKDPAMGRATDQQITVAQLTAPAILDIQIAKALYAKLS